MPDGDFIDLAWSTNGLSAETPLVVLLHGLGGSVHSTSKRDLFSLKTLLEFDDRITAPLHGFDNAQDYYRESSSRQYLSGIATPTLIIYALDDPFMTTQAVPEAKELSTDITIELSRHGGHVGFITGANPGSVKYWLEERIPEFMMDKLIP